MAPSLRPEDIENQQFTVVRLSEAGYRQSEVDDFLDRLHTDYSQMWADLGNMEQQLKSKVTAAVAPLVNDATVQLPKAIASEVAKVDAAVAQNPDSPSLSTIAVMLKAAEDAAAKITADAKAEAERVKGEAYAAGAQMKSDAESALQVQRADAMTALAKLRADAEADIAKAKAEATAFVDKLKADAGSEASALVEAAKAEKAQLVQHVEALTASKSSLLSVVKEVLAKVEGK
jgi:DivIVA domain-containing protein